MLVLGVLSEFRLKRLNTGADFGGNVCTMKSHSGIFLCIRCPYTTESELVALNDGSYGDALRIQTVLEMILGRSIPLVLHEDNQACVHILRSGRNAKLKLMNRAHKIPIAAIHESVQTLGLDLRYTESTDQFADLFTKVLPRIKFMEALWNLDLRYSSGGVVMRASLPLRRC